VCAVSLTDADGSNELSDSELVMPRNDNKNGRNSGEDGTGLSINRRSYLLAAGTAVGSVGLFSGRASAAFERRGIAFERSVNMVTEAGCDPTGQEPCDEQIRAAADDHTLLKFPAGEYKLTENTVVLNKTNLGFLGVGDVRFSVPERFNNKLLTIDRGTGLLFENIDIDLTAYGATPGLHLGVADDLQVHDVEFIGQGIHPDSIPRGEPGWSPGLGAENGNPRVTDAFFPIVRSSDGTGEVTNLVAKNRGLMGSYNAGKGRSGIWVGIQNEGTITFRDCTIEEFGNNGCYTSRTYGVVNYEGGLYRNNDNNQIRIGSPGSSADGTTLIVDADASDSPNPDDALNQRGARVEMGHNYVPTDVTIRNCDIAIRSTSRSGGGVVADHTASQFRVVNTRIGVDVDTVRGVLAKEPDGGVYPPPAKPYDGVLRNVSVTGSASGTAAVELVDRPNSVVESCCIHQEGGGRDGVVFVNADSGAVRRSTIDVPGRTVVSEDCWVNTNAISANGSCPMPAYDGGAASSPDVAFTGTLTIEGTPGAEYELAVSGTLEKSSAMSGTTIDPNDELSGSSVVGQVGDGGRDSYLFSGEITRLVLRGGALLYYNGEQVDPAEYLQNTVTVESQSYTEYEITTSDGIVKSAAMGEADPNDNISGRNASGHVGEGGRDSYAYPGEIVGLDIDGDASVYRNGDEIDPDEVGSTDTLTFEGAPGAGYELAVSGSLEKSTVLGATVDSNDEMSDASATGQVGGGGRDSYEFTGEITRLILWGGANLYYNGEQVDPAEYLQNTVTIESQSDAAYSVVTSDGIVKSAAMGAADPNDDISGRTASGYVGAGGQDSYAYSGEIVGLTIDGDATAYRNGVPVVPDELDTGETLTIEGAPGTEYELAVSDTLEKSTSLDATVDSNDELSGSSVVGQVGGGGRDSYLFTGDITRLVLRGGALLYYNGEQVDPAEYLSNTVTVESQSYAEYEITTSDGIVMSAVMGAADSNDDISGVTASGHVGEGGRDSYAYSGDITSLDIDGDATVYRNGTVLLNPERLSAKRDALPSFGRLPS
jgi:hypothetical protein